MQYIRKNNVARMFSIKCSVTKNQLTNIVMKFAKTQFFIGIYNIESNNFLNYLLANECIEVIESPIKQKPIDITVKVEASYFSSLVDLLLEYEAEVIVFYFSDSNISFEQFSMNKSNFGQRSVISQGLCSFICTWVTNDYELVFHYDANVFQAEIKKEIKKLLDS